jgi:putrescine transport system ATP-binding protein
MDRGRIVQVGTPGEVYEQPRTRFIAEFVGDVNILEGRVAARDGERWAVATPCAPAPLLIADSCDRLAVGSEVAVAVRPEKITLHREAPVGSPNVLAGEVWDVGYLGDWTTYRVRLAGGEIIRVARANATRSAEQPIGWEDRVALSFPPDAAVILTA